MKQNDQQRNFLRTWEKVKNNSNSLSKFYWLSFSALENRYILINFCAISAYKLFLMLDHTKWYAGKVGSVDAELAGHVDKLDVKLQSLCASGFSLFAVRMLVKPYHLEWIYQQHFAKTKMGYISLP